MVGCNGMLRKTGSPFWDSLHISGESHSGYHAVFQYTKKLNYHSFIVQNDSTKLQQDVPLHKLFWT